jgi:hypothetical protein
MLRLAVASEPGNALLSKICSPYCANERQP